MDCVSPGSQLSWDSAQCLPSLVFFHILPLTSHSYLPNTVGITTLLKTLSMFVRVCQFTSCRHHQLVQADPHRIDELTLKVWKIRGPRRSLYSIRVLVIVHSNTNNILTCLFVLTKKSVVNAQNQIDVLVLVPNLTKHTVDYL